MVELIAGKLPPITVYLDAENGDLLKLATRVLASDSGMEVPIRILFEEHSEKDGIRMPRRSVSSNDMSGSVVSEITSVESDLDIDPALFKLPK